MTEEGGGLFSRCAFTFGEISSYNLDGVFFIGFELAFNYPCLLILFSLMILCNRSDELCYTL